MTGSASRRLARCGGRNLSAGVVDEGGHGGKAADDDVGVDFEDAVRLSERVRAWSEQSS